MVSRLPCRALNWIDRIEFIYTACHCGFVSRCILCVTNNGRPVTLFVCLVVFFRCGVKNTLSITRRAHVSYCRATNAMVELKIQLETRTKKNWRNNRKSKLNQTHRTDAGTDKMNHQFVWFARICTFENKTNVFVTSAVVIFRFRFVARHASLSRISTLKSFYRFASLLKFLSPHAFLLGKSYFLSFSRRSTLLRFSPVGIHMMMTTAVAFCCLLFNILYGNGCCLGVFVFIHMTSTESMPNQM